MILMNAIVFSKDFNPGHEVNPQSFNLLEIDRDGDNVQYGLSCQRDLYYNDFVLEYGGEYYLLCEEDHLSEE
jgi:hypothetical protein